MRITVVCDNETRKKGLRAGWGFSALIESEGARPILFDTGADSPTLLHNMKELGIDPKNIGIIVISHAHGDHTGGLFDGLQLIYPCHCTQYKKEIMELFKGRASACGAGLVIGL